MEGKEPQIPQEGVEEESNIVFTPPEFNKISSHPVNELDMENLHFDKGTEVAQDDINKLHSTIKVRCCMCGDLIEPNPSSTCMECLSETIDITEGISITNDIAQCRTCERWCGPPWIYCDRESNEMLTLLLKKIKGMNKSTKILDASLVWTEPHSKRLKVKITISKEVLNNTVMRKTQVITFIEKNQQCDECKKSFTPHTWNAVVQLRQKVGHKRTFMFLEQLILKNKVHEKCLNVEEKDDGLNFYFRDKARAMGLMEFVQNQIVVRVKQSNKLVSHDEKKGTSNSKFTISIDIAPVCKDDLVLLPKKLSRDLGGIGPLVLCYKISKSINIVDVVTMETSEIDSASYWKNPFSSLITRPQAIAYVVRNIDNADFDVNESRAAKRNKFKFAEVEVQRYSEVGVNDQTYFSYTHLGEMLTYDDTVLGYDLESANFSDEQRDLLENKKKQTPDVVLIRKGYPKTRAKRKNKKRKWKLKHLKADKQEDIDFLDHLKSKAPKGSKKAAKHSKKVKKEEKSIANKNIDYELFLQDLEEDREMRGQVNIYKEDHFEEEKEEEEIKKTTKKIDDMKLGDEIAQIDQIGSDTDDENFPDIQDDEFESD
ncbi:unnamed protein product [Moneuplotes crassus]|uniref:60S ribosomal export protein NMD3 n=1 Tax=Euplotes crassus TaxID=5936 RepID=A0AAD1Y8W4_EUPCR|nr:unnamed protein product [Moneuplotes crassus]